MSAAVETPTESHYDVDAIRAVFPALHQQVHGKPLVYLDNAATTHKPQAVLDSLEGFYARDNSNVHRGVHTLSQRATAQYEAARKTLQGFINAPSVDEIIFTAGTTEGLNLVAHSWGRANLTSGDEVVVTEMEHHSNIVPWQMVCEATGATLRVLRMDDRGQLRAGEIDRVITAKTRVLSVVHVSNALGTVNPVEALIAQVRAVGASDAIVVIDGAQSVPHQVVDVQALGCDFFAFSGHKMYGPTGIGVLWGRLDLLSVMPPWQGGGDMIREVSFTGSTYAAPPARFEAGTPNIADAIALGAAAAYLQSIGLAEIAAHEAALLAYGTKKLAAIDGLRLIGTADHKAGVLAFVVDGVHPHDLGTIVDMEGVAVRVGHHCAQPVMQHFGVPATTRASLAMYTNYDDLDRLAYAVGKAVTMLR